MDSDSGFQAEVLSEGDGVEASRRGVELCLQLSTARGIRSRKPFYEERYAPFEDAHAYFDILKHWNFGFVHQVLDLFKA
jgi:hypothetical protein